MTEFVKITTKQTADKIYKGQPFDYISIHMGAKAGDRMTFKPMMSGRVIGHPITDEVYEIVCVDKDAPQLQRGVAIAGLRKVCR